VKGEHRKVGDELLHACDVHWPEPEPDSDEFHEGPFETIELRTGLEMCNEIVAYGNLPPYNVYPEVVMWGIRVFKLGEQRAEGKRATYHEVFAAAIVQWKTSLDQEAGYNGGVDRT